MARKVRNLDLMLDTADEFVNAATLIDGALRDNDFRMVTLVVNGTFALEVYFKYLYCIENSTKKTPDTGHRLEDSFNKLKAESQKAIRNYYNEFQSKNHVNQAPRKHLKSLGITEEEIESKGKGVYGVIPPTFTETLSQVNRAYENWRYFFEKPAGNYPIYPNGLDDLLGAVRQRIEDVRMKNGLVQPR